MPPLDSPLTDTPLLALYAVPLALAMAWDAVSYRIPNWLTAGFALLFPAALLFAPATAFGAVAGHLAAGAIAFAAAAVLFALRAMGGGDVKLLGAAALWLGMGQLLPLLLLTGLLGGALALVVLAARRVLPPLLANLPGGETVTLPRLLMDREGVPYGLAIGAAGLMLANQLPLLG